MKKKSSKKIRLHLTNIKGLGASELIKSLLPALESQESVSVSEMYVPAEGFFLTYKPVKKNTKVTTYLRAISNPISRILECTLLAGSFNGNSALLVLGDVPLRCNSTQVVFVQTPQILKTKQFNLSIDGLKYFVSRMLFQYNSAHVKSFIVQTNVMRDQLLLSYPNLMGRVHVVAQPVPSWLIKSALKRTKRLFQDESLRLIYPAANYPHKNHELLTFDNLRKVNNWPVKEVIFTLDPSLNLFAAASWIKCVGILSPSEMVTQYASVDALLFLSKKESYGLPLVEAMYVGLPIVCPDLPYARTLCGNKAIYFIHDDVKSLHSAITELNGKLKSGWWPDWSGELTRIPKSWEDVAQEFIRIVYD